MSPFLVNSGIELGSLAETFAPNGEDADFEPTDPQVANEIINSYSTAFFDQYFNDQDTLLTDNSSPYPLEQEISHLKTNI